MAKRKIQKKRAAKRGKTVKKAAGKKASRKASKRKVAKTTRTKAAGKKKKATSKGATTRRKTAGKSSTKARRAKSKTARKPSKPARKRFRSAVLVDQSRQIHCEAQMLRSVVSLLSGDGSGSLPASVEDRAHRNALNESFCLHFRTLLDFLWEGRAGKKEAVARDFFATPRRWKPAKPQDYRDLKKRLAKEINALTTTRYSDLSIEEWPYRRIFDEIFVDIDRFRSTAPEENLHECWRDCPIAALSAEGTRSSTVAGTGPGDGVLPSRVESEVFESEVDEPGLTETEAVQPATEATPALVTGSAFSGAESPRLDWSSTTDHQEEHDESQEEASVFARSFSTLGKDED